MTESRRVFPDPEALSAGAAKFVHRCAMEAIARSDRFSIVLAGGNTPRALYRVLAAEYATRIDWTKTQVFFGDERCVPPDHKDSNYAMSQETLLSRVPIPVGNVHPMDGRLGGARGAADYERKLRSLIGDARAPGFDLVLLGMGADGHTLSLFPGHDFDTDDAEKWVVPARAPAGSPVSERITLTLGAVVGAAHALFMVAGKDKAPAVAAVQRARPTGDGPPAARVQCRDLTWYLDRAAAASDTGPLPSP